MVVGHQSEHLHQLFVIMSFCLGIFNCACSLFLKRLGSGHEHPLMLVSEILKLNRVQAEAFP